MNVRPTSGTPRENGSRRPIRSRSEENNRLARFKSLGARSSDARQQTVQDADQAMSWIETIAYEESSGALRAAYDRVKGPDGRIDNILVVHSLRPHTLSGHMQLYKNVLHHTSNRLPGTLLELTGVYVSLLNGCEYCVHHHFEGFCRHLCDDERAHAVRRALETGQWGDQFDDREQAVLKYVERLTRHPETIREGHIVSLRSAGLTDGEILEINQVASYFAYANRTVLGLGCTTEGDELGRSPADSDDPDDWKHA